MAQAARYMFDRAFDDPAKGSEQEEAIAARKLQEEWERKMADACCKAYEEGKAEGEAETMKRLEAEILEQVKVLIGRTGELLEKVEGECEDIKRNAIEVGTVAASRLAGELISRNPTLNLEALFRDALEHIGDAPHIAVTVNDAHAQAVQAAVSAVSMEKGFPGKIVVLGDPETRSGDCSLQWADGGMTLDFERTRREIDDVVRRHLNRIGDTAEASARAPSVAKPGDGTTPANGQGGPLPTENATEANPAPPAGPGEAT